MKKKTISISMTLAAFVCLMPLYEAVAKDKEIEIDITGAAREIKSAAKETGKAIKSGTIAAGRKIKSTAKDKKLRKTAREAGKETKEALKETGRAIKKEVPVEVEKK